MDLTDLDMWARAVPYGEFARLRREAPAAWSPGEGGFWSKLLRAEMDGDRLSETDLDNFFSILVIAGNETTRIAIAHAVLAFGQRPVSGNRDEAEFADPDVLLAALAERVEAERAGLDAIMVSEHVVLGPSSNAAGLPANPRDYALPGNQDPATPWPSPLVLLSAIAAATTRIRDPGRAARDLGESLAGLAGAA